jgi:hypothetical protein
MFNGTDDDASVIWFIGGPNQVPLKDYVSTDAAGWTAAIGFNRPASTPPDQSNNHLLGACFAACLGNAEVFRITVGLKARHYLKAFSLWTNMVYEDFKEIPSSPDWAPANCGKIHLVGCGSIGSSLIYLLPFSGIKSNLLLVDPDNVEGHNTSSSLLFMYADADKAKTKICIEYLAKFGIMPLAFNDDYRNYPYHHNHEDIRSADVILCFANEHNIWSTIQRFYPPISFHATTSKSWGLHIGRHIPLVENCLVCTFKHQLETEFKPDCSKGAIPTAANQVESKEDASHTAILPFLAPAAAIITLAELQKLLLYQHSNYNTILFNMGSSEGGFLHDHDRFGGCFVCKDQEALYSRFGPFGKFWHLSGKSE